MAQPIRKYLLYILVVVFDKKKSVKTRGVGGGEHSDKNTQQKIDVAPYSVLVLFYIL